MSKPLVFLDMDGVIADFHSRAITKHASAGNDNMIAKQWCNSDWLPREADWIPTFLKISEDDFWLPINRDQYFWSNIEQTREARMLVSFLLRWVGADNLFILTAPHTLYSYTEKAYWIKKHFPGIREDHFMISRQKQIAAGPNRLLIDDWPVNCEKWTQSGGLSYLWFNKCGNKLDYMTKVMDFTAWFGAQFKLKL